MVSRSNADGGRLVGVLVVGMLVLGGWGCAGRSDVVRHEQHTQTTASAPASDGHDHRVTERKETTTTRTTDASSGGGFMSGAVNIVGDIIALPFRLIGGLIRLVF